jgi:deoxyribodipyrimidine photo-lyase
MSDSTVVWFRRDLRVADQPMFLAARDSGGRDSGGSGSGGSGSGGHALGLFVLDPALLEPSGPARRTYLYRSLRVLDEQLGGRLLVVRGDPADVVPRVAGAADAREVHVAADHGPYGARRDEAVGKALAGHGRELVCTGSPYAVAPGRVRKPDGDPYKVFTPYRRAWAQHGWRGPAESGAGTLSWLDPSWLDPRWLDPGWLDPGESGLRRMRIPADEALPDLVLPEAGESAAKQRWREFLDGAVTGYQVDRDRPDHEGTSRMSAYLKYGQIHPRTMLADLASKQAEPASQSERESLETYRTELAWREFYADVLHQRPDSARQNYDRRFDHLPWDDDAEAEKRFDAWCAGRTGYPIVDAGMRQLLAEGWMHNRVRMIVASFLVKDLHLPWWWGARHFMHHLVDGDLASNRHGWQWTAGSGTDASPYYRIFNPTTQGERFDPDGGYVRRYVPALRGVPGNAAHQPWKLPGGVPVDYPEPMVDHAEERKDALARYEAIRAR